MAHEELEADDFGEGQPRLWHIVRHFGPHVAELNICPHCGSEEYDFHPFEESAQCSNCGQRYATFSPVTSVTDEMLDRIFEAIQGMKDSYPAVIFGEGDESLEEIPVKYRALVMAKAARMARHVIDNALETIRLMREAVNGSGEEG